MASHWDRKSPSLSVLSVPVHHGRQEVKGHDSAASLPPNSYRRIMNVILGFHRSQITAVMVWWCNDVMTHLSEQLKLIQLISPSRSAWAWMFWCSRCSEYSDALRPSQKVKGQVCISKCSEKSFSCQCTSKRESLRTFLVRTRWTLNVSRFFCWFHEYLLMNVMFSLSG